MSTNKRRSRTGGVEPLSDMSAAPQINMRALETLIAVASTGSMTLAARQLGMTQSAVSQAIQQLERSTGVLLFDRAVKPSALTLEGRTIVKHASEVLERLQALRHALQFREGQQVPLLRIGLVDSFATAVGPSLLVNLRNLAREWMVCSGVSETRIDALLERRVDFIVTSDESPLPKNVVSFPILAEPYFAVVSSTYRKPTKSLRQLAENLDLIRYSKNLYISRWIEHYLESQKIVASHKFQFDTVGSVMAMVEAGLGWAIATPLGFYRAGLRRNFRCLPLDGPVMLRRLHLLARKNEGEQAAAWIAAASIEALRGPYLAEVEALVPWALEHIRLG
ncbi:MAG TPA: LysR family transcriptional regulator [Rhodoblastus sp.]|nr:LysR family transcriptional regulator [Rhodoblastus sp.]